MTASKKAVLLICLLGLLQRHVRGKFGCCKVSSVTQVVQQAGASAPKVVGAVASAVSNTAKVSAGGSLSVSFSNGGVTASGSLTASTSLFGESLYRYIAVGLTLAWFTRS